MTGPSRLERRFRAIAIALSGIALSAATGVGVAQWAIGDANGFYMNPVAHYGSPAYARQQPVADSFWERQDADGHIIGGYQPAAISTATSAQPTYRSASGS